MSCPSCGCDAVDQYPRLWHCRECGDHGGDYKRPTTPGDRTRRAKWQARIMAQPESYVSAQVLAMGLHLRATPALASVSVAPHTAFGGYCGESWELT